MYDVPYGNMPNYQADNIMRNSLKICGKNFRTLKLNARGRAGEMGQ